MCSITNAAKFERLKHSRLTVIALILTCLLLAVARPLGAQAGFGDDRVMLQGFYYESYRYGHLAKFPDKVWYEVVRSQAAAIANANFDLVWLPPPSYAGPLSGGYNPKQSTTRSNTSGSTTATGV